MVSDTYRYSMGLERCRFLDTVGRICTAQFYLFIYFLPWEICSMDYWHIVTLIIKYFYKVLWKINGLFYLSYSSL